MDASHLSGRQGRVALAYLVAERDRPVPSEELAEVVWGAVPPTTWRPALRGIVSRVRDFLEALGLPAAELLTSSSGCYQLTLPGGALVDLELAAEQAERAETVLATGDLERALAAAGCCAPMPRPAIGVRRCWPPTAATACWPRNSASAYRPSWRRPTSTF